MSTRKKAKLEAVKDVTEKVQKSIDEHADAPAVAAAAKVIGAPEETGPPTHGLVPLQTLNQLIPFLHGQGSDMAKSFAGVLAQSRPIRVEQDSPAPEQ